MKTFQKMRLGALWAVFVIGAASLLFSATAQTAPGDPAKEGVILTLDGAVSPPVAAYLAREIGVASDAGKGLVIVEIDTPGGLVDSMKTIIKAILASDTPVATYVSPQGARSASAGLYIMYSAHVSAMAPATNTGAATPVEVGGSPSDDRSPLGDNPFEENQEPTPEENAEAAPADGEADAGPDEAAETASSETANEADDTAREESPLSSSDALRAKVINDSVAYIRALAEERGRNADWAESAVREAASVTANEALELGVIDLVAEDIDELLAAIDGRTVKVASGEKTIDTDGIRLERIAPQFVERILAFIADPNVAVILMSLATTGIIIEMWNPGSIFPGAVGVVCLILGFYAFQVLPFNWLGVALMMAGAVLMLLEAFTPTFGLAGLAGLLIFGFGLFVVFPEGFRVSPTVIASIVAIAGGFLALVLFAVVGSRSHGPLIGAEAIRKREGVVDDWDGREGWVIVEGERWRARSDKPLAPGDRIKVIEVDGLVLVVKQAKAGGLLSALQPKEA
ncbi:MAG: nodulation protein NfeD [Pseudomonadota bacterium]